MVLVRCLIRSGDRNGRDEGGGEDDGSGVGEGRERFGGRRTLLGSDVRFCLCDHQAWIDGPKNSQSTFHVNPDLTSGGNVRE